ncbi:hypothetical protein O7599_30240 [Streptomyces sp. WMMC500]|uniref:hypothetical protein n=1 Tax=Streptomyces sp. WMMC500 TaxID=3015154 RepID=UPI00248B8BC6|nr:hypothetical protein [Streptomyces sp. WMMC500]WBB59788.1 hypothetical protein O7599_30240 [Streptomyces sp. WMMC500]
MSGARRVWTAIAAALLGALTVLLLCRYTVADPAYYTSAVREADGYQRVYDEVLPDPAVRRALRTGALGIPLRSDAVVDNLPLLVPRPALEQAAHRQARALVAALTGTGGPAPGDDWRGPVTESATEAGSDQLRALRADADPAAARGLTQLINRLREYVNPSRPAATPASALRAAVAGFVHETWPPDTARRIMTALDEVLPGARENRHAPAAGAGTRAEAGALLVGRGDVVGRPELWSVAGGSGAGVPEGGGARSVGPQAVGVHGAETGAPLVARRDAVGPPGSSSDAWEEGRGALVAGGGAGPDGRVQAVGEARAPSVAETGAGPGPAAGAAPKLSGWVPERGAVVRIVLAASASWWAVAAVAAAAAGAVVPALRAAARARRPRARTAAAACAGAAVLTAAAGTAVWAALPASARLVPDGLPPSVSALLTDVVAGLYREAALTWAGALLTLALAAAALALTASTAARGALRRTLAAVTDTAVTDAAAMNAAVTGTAVTGTGVTDAAAPHTAAPYTAAPYTAAPHTAAPHTAVTDSAGADSAGSTAATGPGRPASGPARAHRHRTPAPAAGRAATAPPPATDPRPRAPKTAPHPATPPPPARTTAATPKTPRAHRPDAASAAASRTPAAPPLDPVPAGRAPSHPGAAAALPTAPAVRRLPAAAPPPDGACAPPPKASRSRRVRRVGVGAAVVAALAQVWVLVGVPSADALACNGDVALCDRPYDRVVQVGSHNAMATVPDGFLGAHQDVSLTGQLDRGARALLLDTHYWETAERLVPPAGTAGLDAAARATLVRAVDSVVRPRPGTWLCHGPCRMGATPLAAQLRELRGWLEAHPRDVVTLVVQDGISPRDTARAFRAAGLGPYLHRPDPDPAAPWPTLGEMADSGRRLVVFAEEADGPAPWYRNFYDYAVETPYRARSADELNCAPHRGGSDPRKRLFLLNHFVTHGMGAPRTEAAAVNDADVIVRRARTCALLRGRLPTIVAVNHMTLGDAVGAVRRLNSESP